MVATAGGIVTTEGIAVFGKGEVRSAPDTVEIVIGVRSRRDTVAQATADAAAKGRAIIDELIAAGVPAPDIQTRDLSVNAEHEYPPGGGAARLLGYAFTNTVVARVRALDDAGAVIDRALAAGGDDAVLDGVMFALDDDAGAAIEARAAAYEDARTKAEQLAALAGVTLGAPTSIEETLSGPPGPMMFAALRGKAGSETAVAPGRVSTVVAVNVRFSIS
jgi:uncharacterized protein YggE